MLCRGEGGSSLLVAVLLPIEPPKIHFFFSRRIPHRGVLNVIA